MAKSKIDPHKVVTDKILAMLEGGVVPWQRPWHTTAAMRMSSKTLYRGVNQWLLEAGDGPGGNWWGTYRQIEAEGGKVRGGEKGSLSVFFRVVEKKDGDKYAMLRHSYVFNCTQVDWPDGVVPEKFLTVVNNEDPIEAAEAIWNGYKGRPSLSHGGDRAYYTPLLDSIQMPLPESFTSRAAYYSTLFHEGGHSTGHEKRLNRPELGAGGFGSHTYGLEELTAEMTSAMLLGHAGIECQHEQNAAYIGSWLKTIKESPTMVVRAGTKAQSAVDHILGTKFAKSVDKEDKEG